MFPLLVGLDFATIRAEDIPEGVMPKRAVVGTGVTTSTSPTSTPTTTSTSPTTAPTTSASSVSTNGNGETSTSAASSTTVATTVPTTIAVTTTNQDGSTTTTHISTNSVKSVVTSADSKVTLASTTIDPATLQHKTVVSSALVTKSTERSTFTSYYTTDGHRATSIWTSDTVVSSTTGYAKSTITPALADGGGSGGHSGLSSHSKSIIGGVVGGIGGAVLVGAIAFVLWRVWGKRQQHQEDDGYNSSPGMKENRSSTMSFGTDYRNPGGSVNTASNF